MKIKLLLAGAVFATAANASTLYSNDIESGSGLTYVSGDPNPADAITTFDYQDAAGLGETPTAGSEAAHFWGGHSGMVHELDFSLSGAAGRDVVFSVDNLWKHNNTSGNRGASFEIFSIASGTTTLVGELTGTVPTKDPSSALGDGVWSTYFLNAGALADGDYRLRVTVATTGDNGTFDNFQVNAIPEPTSAALLGLGGLAFITRRRR